MYMFIDALRLMRGFWSLASRESIAEDLSADLREFSKETLIMNLYIPLRADIDIITWISSDTPKQIARFRWILRSRFGRYLREALSFFAVYRHSQYFPPHQDLREYLMKASKDPYEYLVAYPMKKSPEWYLLSFEERKRIMAEHAALARSLSSDKKIRSYTAYSYGIDNNEFLVIYEVDDLMTWNMIVEKLREAEHRKWVTREEPILIGRYISLETLERALKAGRGSLDI